MSRYTCDGQMRASGIGSLTDAYKRLLFNLCKSGCVLDSIEVVPAGLVSTLILYTVSGTEAELATFRREVNGG